jgi:hypothetical protein
MATLRHTEFVSATTTTIGTDTLTTPLLDLSKSALFYSMRFNTNSPANYLIRGDITDKNTVTFNKISAGSFPVEGYVAEWLYGVKVERGSFNGPGATSTPWSNTIILNNIQSLNKSFIFYGMNHNTGNHDDTCQFSCYLWQDGSNIKATFDAQKGVSPQIINWQVIQYSDCSVQRGSITSMASGDTTAIANINAVTLNKSFINFSWNCGTGSVPNIGQKQLSAKFNSTTQIEFQRDNIGVAINDIRWEVISFTDGTTVQEHLLSFPPTGATRNVQNNPITAVSATNRVVVFTPAHMGGGRTDYATDDNTGRATWTNEITSTTNLLTQRSGPTTTSQAYMTAYVIDFDNTIPIFNKKSAHYIYNKLLAGM